MAAPWDVEEGVARPQEAANDDLGASTLVLNAPAEVRGSGDVLRGRVEEVNGPVEVGALKERLLEELVWRMHVQIVAQLARLTLAQT